MAEFTTTSLFRHAYKLDEEVLRDIFERAKSFVETDVAVEFNFGGVHKITSADLDDLLKDSLIRTDVITGVDIAGMNTRKDPTHRFAFRSEGFDATISVDIAGPQDASRALRSRVESLIEAKEQWYWPFSIRRFSLFSLVWVFFLGFALNAILVFVLWLVKVPSSGLVIALLLGLLAFAILPFYLLPIMFPVLIFEIGRSAQIASRAQTIRNVVFVVLGAGLIVAVGGAWLAEFLPKPT